MLYIPFYTFFVLTKMLTIAIKLYSGVLLSYSHANDLPASPGLRKGYRGVSSANKTLNQPPPP